MSGLGTCPACGKTAMIRSGAQQCTRCESAATRSPALPEVAGQTAPDLDDDPRALMAADDLGDEVIDVVALGRGSSVRPPRKRRDSFLFHGRVMSRRHDEETDADAEE